MEARSVPPPRRGRPLTPEEEDAERERFELGERLQAARRWAYFATFVAFLAAAGAGVALAWGFGGRRPRTARRLALGRARPPGRRR
jgi:hypothetical protein